MPLDSSFLPVSVTVPTGANGFPWGTFVVNMIGSFLIGFLWQLFEYVPISPNMRSLIFIGGLGAFTTFSTFAFETATLLQGGQVAAALLNVGVQTVLGVALVLVVLWNFTMANAWVFRRAGGSDV